jgi:hypothetical protein
MAESSRCLSAAVSAPAAAPHPYQRHCAPLRASSASSASSARHPDHEWADETDQYGRRA